MEKRILVDSDILIKSYRGDLNKYQQLQAIEKKFVISVVTAIELIAGAKNIKQLISTRKELRIYFILHFDTEISTIVYRLFSKYTLRHSLRIPDLIIAATALRYRL